MAQAISAENEAKIIAVERRGWAGDTFYQVQNGKEEPIELDAYKFGSALLQPGQKVKMPAQQNQRTT